LPTTTSAVTKHRLTIAEYYTLAESLPGEARVELLDGELYDMAPIGSQHADIVEFLGDRLRYALPPEFGVRRQNPVRLGNHSEPQPDICVEKPRALPYSQSHPGPEDVLLVIEVADHTLQYDKDIKLPLYARYGIPEVWIVDLKNRQLEVYTAPQDEAYQKSQRLRGTDKVIPHLLPDITVNVEVIFARL
jgi:Uma2 family endonuclease